MNQSLTARYWRIVRACLVEFHGYSNHAAVLRVREFRAALTALKHRSDDPHATDLIYHEEALNLANDLSQSSAASVEDQWARYLILREQVDPSRAMSRKSILPAKSLQGARPVAARRMAAGK
jgi:hypothetical protein